MPWKETHVMEERLKFVAQYSDGTWQMAELCRAFGISRRTGYKIVRRYREEGVSGLSDRSRAPLHHPNAVSPALRDEILLLRDAHGTWGPRKLRAHLAREKPGLPWPAVSTVGEILKRAGKVKPRRRGRRGRSVPSEQPFGDSKDPNDVWCADHKGWFRTRDGRRCEPLTISDAVSRYLVSCLALSGTTWSEAYPVFERAFLEYGLPLAIRTDNGSPFASKGIGGLTRLAVWWIRLGIVPQRIQPGRPDQNGRHERMHRTLKAETCHPPQSNHRTQQKAFDCFRKEYNQVRPHEALSDRPPAEFYLPSPRAYPATLPEVEYPAHFEIRRVRTNGSIKWKGAYYFLSEALRGQTVGLMSISEDRWEIHFGRVALGVLNDHHRKILRHRVLVLT
jgi:transposase InsO family protein